MRSLSGFVLAAAAACGGGSETTDAPPPCTPHGAWDMTFGMNGSVSVTMGATCEATARDCLGEGA